MNLSSKVMVGETPKWRLLIVTLTLGSVWDAAGAGGAAAASVCVRGRTWWDRHLSACAPCTRCDPALRLAVKYPCELHRDTVCQPLHQLIIWPSNDSEVPTQPVPVSNDYEYSSDYDSYDYETMSDNDSERWDVQSSFLTVAASGCVVFFVVVLCMSLYHAKQWRILKQALKSDVQDLSAKLKLMESGATLPADPVLPGEHHIYCNIQVTKDSLLDPPTNKKGFGNVYTQEKHCS